MGERISFYDTDKMIVHTSPEGSQYVIPDDPALREYARKELDKIFAKEAEARRAARQLKKNRPNWWKRLLRLA